MSDADYDPYPVAGPTVAYVVRGPDERGRVWVATRPHEEPTGWESLDYARQFYEGRCGMEFRTEGPPW